MCAADARPADHRATCERSQADVIEACARRGRMRDVVYAARARGLELPGVGASVWSADVLAVCTRPDRWLIVTAPQAPLATATRLQSLLGTGAIVVDQSSGLGVYDLPHSGWRSLLAHGCSIDLDPSVFAAGHAAATLLAQVPVVLVPHPSGVLLIAAATYGEHLRQWLRLAAQRAAPPVTDAD